MGGAASTNVKPEGDTSAEILDPVATNNGEYLDMYPAPQA